MSHTHHNTAIKATLFSIFGNLIIALIKLLSGLFGNSYVLVADAIESSTDIFSSILVLFGLKYANKPADKNHPYGHGRAEPLITFLVVGFLIFSAILIIHESINSIQTPHELPQKWTLFILAPLIVWKEISFQIVMKRAKETNISALKADAWHHRSDAFTSVAAFIGISIALFFGKGYEAADDWAALLASGAILYNSYKIFRPALGEIMDESLNEDLVEEIRKIAITVNGVLGTEKCYIRKSGLKFYVDLHASVNGDLSVKEGHFIAHQLKDKLMEKLPTLGDVLIHIEPN